MNNDILKPWARWMINHKLKWLLIFYVYLLLPVWLILGFFSKVTIVNSVIEWADNIEILEQLK